MKEGERKTEMNREKMSKEKNKEALNNTEGPEKKYVNPSAMLKGQMWTVWQQLSAGRLLGGSKESGLRT